MTVLFWYLKIEEDSYSFRYGRLKCHGDKSGQQSGCDKKEKDGRQLSLICVGLLS